MINISKLKRYQDKVFQKDREMYNQDEINHLIYNDLPIDTTKVSKEKMIK